MRILSDLAYGAHPEQALDLALPGAPRAVVCYAHGGGFVRGSRKEATFAVLTQALWPLGIATASVGYRLRGTVGDLAPDDQIALRRMVAASLASGLRLQPALYGAAFALALFDLSSAVAALRSGQVAPQTRGLPIVVLGMSAGGIAALSLAYPPRVWARRLERPAGVVAVSAAMVQPWRLCAGGPPCVMLHSKSDRIIPPSDARLAQAVAQGAGADLRLIESDVRGHVPQLDLLLKGTLPGGRPGLSLLTDLVARVCL